MKIKGCKKLIEKYFPIISQTSHADKLLLLKSIAAVRERCDKFKYIEIGSYLGGSLTPFLLEESCELVVSVDERERQQPDERGAKYDYAGITSQTMINNLASHNISVEKLITHDGQISTLKHLNNKFDIAFIDGEHTDVACVRDFLWTFPIMKVNSLILFHDSTIVYKALAIIREIMISRNIEFKLEKFSKSEISILMTGSFSRINSEALFGETQEWSEFQGKSEVDILSSLIAKRAKFTVGYTIEPAPVLKA